MYVSIDFLNRMKMNNLFSEYLEFIGSKIHSPSYLSLEYVLYENNILTEVPQNLTFVTTNKSCIFKTKFTI